MSFEPFFALFSTTFCSIQTTMNKDEKENKMRRIRS